MSAWGRIWRGRIVGLLRLGGRIIIRRLFWRLEGGLLMVLGFCRVVMMEREDWLEISFYMLEKRGRESAVYCI